MKKIFFNFYVVILVLGLQNIHAQVVATVCIENKHTEKAPCDATSYVENKLMGVLFDEGFIVTNLPCIKEEINFYNSYNKKQYAFESDPDYIILLYFSYDSKKKYDEVKKKNILQCKDINCKVIKRGSSQVLYEKAFGLEKLNIIGIYKKLDFCLSQLSEKVVEEIRRSK